MAKIKKKDLALKIIKEHPEGILVSELALKMGGLKTSYMANLLKPHKESGAITQKVTRDGRKNIYTVFPKATTKTTTEEPISTDPLPVTPKPEVAKTKVRVDTPPSIASIPQKQIKKEAITSPSIQTTPKTKPPAKPLVEPPTPTISKPAESPQIHGYKPLEETVLESLDKNISENLKSPENEYLTPLTKIDSTLFNYEAKPPILPEWEVIEAFIKSYKGNDPQIRSIGKQMRKYNKGGHYKGIYTAIRDSSALMNILALLIRENPKALEFAPM